MGPRQFVLLLLLTIFLVELPALQLLMPPQGVVTMDSLRAEREKRETPEEAKRPWDGLYLTGPFALEKRPAPTTDGRAPVPPQGVVTMDSLRAEREKRETPEEAKRPWDGLYLTGPRAFEKREVVPTDGRAPASK